MTFGTDVRRAREVLGMTLLELSSSSNLRIATISEIENDKTNPQAKTVGKIRKAFQTRMDVANNIHHEDQAWLNQFLMR